MRKNEIRPARNSTPKQTKRKSLDVARVDDKKSEPASASQKEPTPPNGTAGGSQPQKPEGAQIRRSSLRKKSFEGKRSQAGSVPDKARAVSAPLDQVNHTQPTPPSRKPLKNSSGGNEANTKRKSSIPKRRPENDAAASGGVRRITATQNNETQDNARLRQQKALVFTNPKNQARKVSLNSAIGGGERHSGEVQNDSRPEGKPRKTSNGSDSARDNLKASIGSAPTEEHYKVSTSSGPKVSTGSGPDHHPKTSTGSGPDHHPKTSTGSGPDHHLKTSTGSGPKDEHHKAIRIGADGHGQHKKVSAGSHADPNGTINIRPPIKEKGPILLHRIRKFSEKPLEPTQEYIQTKRQSFPFTKPQVISSRRHSAPGGTEASPTGDDGVDVADGVAPNWTGRRGTKSLGQIPLLLNKQVKPEQGKRARWKEKKRSSNRPAPHHKILPDYIISRHLFYHDVFWRPPHHHHNNFPSDAVPLTVDNELLLFPATEALPGLEILADTNELNVFLRPQRLEFHHTYEILLSSYNVLNDRGETVFFIAENQPRCVLHSPWSHYLQIYSIHGDVRMVILKRNTRCCVNKSEQFKAMREIGPIVEADAVLDVNMRYKSEPNASFHIIMPGTGHILGHFLKNIPLFDDVDSICTCRYNLYDDKYHVIHQIQAVYPPRGASVQEGDTFTPERMPYFKVFHGRVQCGIIHSRADFRKLGIKAQPEICYRAEFPKELPTLNKAIILGFMSVMELVTVPVEEDCCAACCVVTCCGGGCSIS